MFLKNPGKRCFAVRKEWVRHISVNYFKNSQTYVTLINYEKRQINLRQEGARTFVNETIFETFFFCYFFLTWGKKLAGRSWPCVLDKLGQKMFSYFPLHFEKGSRGQIETWALPRARLF